MASEAPVGKRPSVTNAELKKSSSQLKHVTTKEFDGEPSAEEVEAIRKIYDEKGSNPTALANEFGLDADILMENLPQDVKEFARGLFSGLYSLDKDEAAKDRLRQRLAVDIKRTSSRLRKSVTRESTGPSADDVAAAAKFWEDHNGNVAVIAEKLNISEELLKQDPPSDANNFGEKVLAGNYTPETDEVAKQNLRENLRAAIVNKRPSLKKTSTKEGEGLSSDDPMIEMAVKLYPGRNAKEIEAVAAQLGLSAAHMKSNPGENEQDFARKVLSGVYTADNNEVAKKELRVKLQAAIKERRASLTSPKKPTHRRISQVSDEEFTNFSAFYTKKGGNLEAIAAESGLPLDALKMNPPHNAADFVLKLMSGMYTVDMNEQSKATLRACMRQEMARTSSLLKKTSTKEWDGKVDEADLKLIAAAYTKSNGDLKYLASTFSINQEALTAKPPKDAEDFAKNVLLGSYTTA